MRFRGLAPTATVVPALGASGPVVISLGDRSNSDAWNEPVPSQTHPHIILSMTGGFYTFAKIALNVVLGRSAASALARSGL